MSWIDSNKTLYSNITTFNKKYYWDSTIATCNVWTAGGKCVTYVPVTICLHKWSTVALQRCHRLQIIMSRCEGTCLFGISSFLCFSVKMKYRNVHAYSINVEQISRYKCSCLFLMVGPCYTVVYCKYNVSCLLNYYTNKPKVWVWLNLLRWSVYSILTCRSCGSALWNIQSVEEAGINQIRYWLL